MKHKYKKPERCDYPVENDGISYCWSWARLKDFDGGEPNKENTEKFEKDFCEGCDLYCNDSK